jgi:hypothetical protein
MSMTWHASLQPKDARPIPWAIIRDTWSNLERTTLRSFLFPTVKASHAAQILPYLKVRDGGKYIELPGFWTAFLFGADSYADLNKLQSMQLGGLWLEEAAPAMEEDIGSGIQENVWSIGLTSLRHPCEWRRGQITMNYPDEDHWTWKRFHDHFGVDDPETARLFRIPSGENPYIDDQYRMNMRGALKNKPDLLARLAEGRPAQVQIGEAVTPGYQEGLHRSRVILPPIAGIQVIRMWDGGLNPTCVFTQITPSGRFHVLDTLRGENIGMKQLIAQYVKTLIANRYSHITSWKDIGDPSLNEREQSDSVNTAAQVINSELNTSFEAGIASWDARREAIRELLVRLTDTGEAMFQVSKHDTIMHKTLNGGWHYKKTPTGQVLRDKPVKDINSHPGDALTHGIAKIFQYKATIPPVPYHIIERQLNRAKGYAPNLDYQKSFNRGVLR